MATMPQFQQLTGSQPEMTDDSLDNQNDDFEDDQDLEDDDLEDEDDDSDGDDDEDEDEDPFALLDQIEDDDDDDDDSDNATDMGKVQKDLQTDMMNAIKGMSIPEEVIPDDFDPSDSKQLRGVLNDVQQRTALNTLSLVFKPVQVALTQMQTNMGKEIGRRIREATDSLGGQSVLAQEVPEISDPKLGPMIRTMDAAYKAKGKKPLERAKMIRKVLDTTGLKGKGNKSKNQSRSRRQQSTHGNSGFLEGSAALDIFAPMPKQTRSGRSRSRRRG